jgi:hypothetical protein
MSAHALARRGGRVAQLRATQPAELRGHVVLVDFWTLTCINWLRTEPYLRAWWQAYRNDGLVVIGTHTPDFSVSDVVDGILFLESSPDLTGEILHIDGGQIAGH